MRRRVLLPVPLALLATMLVWFQPTAGANGLPPTEWASRSLPVAPLGGTTASLRPAANGVIARATGSTPSSTICSPFWFTGVGVTWNHEGPEGVGVQIRTSADGVDFGPRRDLHADPDHAPDPGTGEAEAGLTGSPLLWTGGSSCIKVALELREGQSLSDLTVYFVNTSGTAAGPDEPAVEGPTEASAPAALTPAAAWTTQPDMVMRDDWGARRRSTKPSCKDILYADEVKVAFVHHTDNSNNYSRNESDDIMRAIQAYHINGQGWCDIAYNFLIDKYGKVFEGREGGVTLPVISGATQGVNTGSTSVALIGSYQRSRPTKPELRSLKKLLAWRLDIAHANPSGKDTLISSGGDNTKYDNGDEVRLNVISGHRDTGFTDCPGNHTYKLLRKIRRSVTAMGQPKIYGPTLSRAAMPLGDPDGIRFKAKGSALLDWTVEIEPVGDDTVVRTMTQSGIQSGNPLNILWHGNDDADQPLPVGYYDVKISGENADGKLARPAHLEVRIRQPAS